MPYAHTSRICILTSIATVKLSGGYPLVLNVRSTPYHAPDSAPTHLCTFPARIGVITYHDTWYHPSQCEGGLTP